MDFLKIKAFAFDIDGVATDGSILCIPGGDLLRVYDAKDSFAVRMATMNGYPVAVITGGSSLSIRERMVTTGLKPEDVFLHCRNKMDEFRQFCERYGLQPEDVMYFGDDIPDIEVIQTCGCGVCPYDAVEEVKAAADYISPFPGGKGCLRDTIEKVMRAQGRWVFDTDVYKKKF
jgi:3-deoxy-D-manno-octulosonate 8-phosphate phosphatase (KDO 8-P phosphatase)